jgi:hypothetical protein
MKSFTNFLEMALGEKYWYHITYAKNMPSIAWKGLIRNARPNWSHGGYDIHSKEGIYVTIPQLISYWIEKFQNLAEHNSDNILQDKLIPIILRFKLHEEKLKPDQLGNPEDRAYQAQRIKPERIEMWTGRSWRNELTLAGIKTSDFLQKMHGDIYFKDRYPLPPTIS